MARGYRRLSLAEIDEIWVRLQAGHAAKPAARALGLPTSTVRTYLLRCGGIRPDPRRRSPGRVSFAEREEISRGLAADMSLREIAVELGRAPSTVSREVAAHMAAVTGTGPATRTSWRGRGRRVPRRASSLPTRPWPGSWRRS